MTKHRDHFASRQNIKLKACRIDGCFLRQQERVSPCQVDRGRCRIFFVHSCANGQEGMHYCQLSQVSGWKGKWLLDDNFFLHEKVLFNVSKNPQPVTSSAEQCQRSTQQQCVHLQSMEKALLALSSYEIVQAH
ncbi:hypothetical protein T4A_5688 [Trichinella pseudospiralis]|uniref:Uncharacterized protein n=1 Tax=Trichinella pseudospiralis TaxID=6337 RepID=A0A0V1DU94_TRIPS|nr:hypothetical protein T4A_5688 [Trichinella pseudospiralis]